VHSRRHCVKICAREKVAAHIVPNLGSSDEQPRLEQHGRRISCRASYIVAESRIELSQLDLVVK
jgi:hypothetical protein